MSQTERSSLPLRLWVDASRLAPAFVLALALLLTTGCGSSQETSPTPNDTATPTPTATPTSTPAPTVQFTGPFPLPMLSDYHFFKGFEQGELWKLEPNDGVLFYDVNSPLFSDGAGKPRFIALPPGSAVDFSDTDPWTWPDGTILLKNFLFPLDARDPEGPYLVVETRLLIKEGPVWTAHTYHWNEEQTDAESVIAGGYFTLTLTGSDGQSYNQLYQMPNTIQCANCHANSTAVLPIGPSTRQLNRQIEGPSGPVNQLEWLASQGLFGDTVLPAPSTLPALADPHGAAPLEDRARAYLEANCAHCHMSGGAAHASGLYLTAAETSSESLGICKSPVAAGPGSGGLQYDIVPGSSDESILIFRMDSTEPEVKMPELGNLQIDYAGLEVIRSWIDAMPPSDCAPQG